VTIPGNIRPRRRPQRSLVSRRALLTCQHRLHATVSARVPQFRAANKDARARPRWHAGRSSAGRAAVQSRSGYGGKPQSAAPIEAAGRSISPTVAGGRRAKILQKTPEPPGGYVPEHCDDFCRQVRGLEAHAQDHSHFCGRFCACLFWFSSGCLMPEAMADEARSFATSQESTMFVTVRTVAPIRLVEFGAGLYVLMGVPVTPFTEHMGPMVEPDFGGPIPIPAGAIAECPRYHDQGLS
jgi:hypothetical protein